MRLLGEAREVATNRELNLQAHGLTVHLQTSRSGSPLSGSLSIENDEPSTMKVPPLVGAGMSELRTSISIRCRKGRPLSPLISRSRRSLITVQGIGAPPPEET